MSLLNNIVDAIVGFFATATPIFNNMVDAIVGFFAAATPIFNNMVDAIVGFFATATPIFNNMVDAIVGFFAAATPIFNNMVDAIVGFFAATTPIFNNMIDAIVVFFAAATPIFNNMVDAIVVFFTAAAPIFNNMVNAVLGFFAAAPLASSNLSPTVLSVIFYYNIGILIYFFMLNFFYIVLLLLATSALFYYKRNRQLRNRNKETNAFAPSIAILAPAYNEEPTIIESVRALLHVDYTALEVIVINDGSKDQTLTVLKDAFNLFPVPRAVDEKIPTKPVREVYQSAVDSRLIVIDKENGGKADSLNTGINYSRSRLFCAIDADSLIEKDGLNRLMQFYMERETKVVALGGIVRIANGCRIENGKVIEARLPRKFLPAMQVMEYIRAFLCGRAGWDKLNCLLIISGAFGLFERKSVIDAGGYRTDTVGEDMELVVRLHRTMREQKRPYKILFIPDPVCWTQAPDSLKMLGRQRNRWQRGLIETMSRHWKMIGNPKYGLPGVLIMPYFLFFEVLGPVIEVSGYIVVIASYVFGWIDVTFLLLFLSLAILFGVLLSLFSLLLEEHTLKRYENPKDVVRLFVLAVLENFGYRQLNSWWRLQAIFDVLRRKKAWGEMQRKAFVQS